MCGRFTLTSDADTLHEAFELSAVPQDLAPRYNIAPTQSVAVVVNNEAQNSLDAFRWGLIPFWAKDAKIGSRMINARGETVAEKPSFKRSFKTQRCLILANGFYEWQKTAEGKVPTYIHLDGHQPFAFAGLWDRWKSPDGEEIFSCTIITTEPNDVLAPIHNRMPVILPQDVYRTWLNPEETAPDTLLPLLKPYDPAAMHTYPVSRLVNSPANDTAACILPA